MLERILIVGFGSIGSRHARLAREIIPDVQIAVLRHQQCDDIPTGAIDYCFTSLDEALQFRPQAAVIANPATHHLKSALPLANAGVHLLIEKPIASTPQGVTELIDICRAKGTVLMTAYNLRFLPALQRFRESLDAALIGRVLSVHAEVGQFLPGWRPGVDYRNTVSAKAELGGGALLELSHDIDYLHWLFGDIQWVSAFLRTQSDLEIDVEDTALLTLGFTGRNGVKSLIATLNVDFVRHDSTRTCVAIGETGTLRWNAITGTVDLFKKGEPSWQTICVHPPKRDESYMAEWHHFINCILQGTPPLISGQDGLAVLNIIQAARLSSAKRSVVETV
ncbi:MAG: Gfo/Idh/MocA family oxidoreductase [Candidatus Nitrotoga sp.]